MSTYLTSLPKTNHGTEYVVARRKGGYGVLFIIMIFIGFDCIVVNAASFFLVGFYAINVVTVMMGFALFIGGITLSVEYYKIPEVAISYKSGVFRIGKNLTCNPSELGQIGIPNAQSSNADYSKTGELLLVIKGKRYVFRFIAEVRKVEVIMTQIKQEFMQNFYEAQKRLQREKILKRELAEQEEQSKQTEQVERQKASEPIVQPSQPEQINATEKPAQLVLPEEQAHTEKTEQVQKAEQREEQKQPQPEQPEQTEEEEAFVSPELWKIADDIKLPDMPDLPDLPD